jgi:hypothetical protein
MRLGGQIVWNRAENSSELILIESELFATLFGNMIFPNKITKLKSILFISESNLSSYLK